MREEFFPKCEALDTLLSKSIDRGEKSRFALIHCDKMLPFFQISNRIVAKYARVTRRLTSCPSTTEKFGIRGRIFGLTAISTETGQENHNDDHCGNGRIL